MMFWSAPKGQKIMVALTMREAVSTLRSTRESEPCEAQQHDKQVRQWSLRRTAPYFSGYRWWLVSLSQRHAKAHCRPESIERAGLRYSVLVSGLMRKSYTP